MSQYTLLVTICVVIAAVEISRVYISFGQHSPTLLIRNEDVVNNAQVLVLTVIKDSHSWGRERSFLDHLNIIESLGYPLSSLSLGFLVADEQEFKDLQILLSSTTFKEKEYARITLIKRDFPVNISRGERHDAKLQRIRRSIIARARNNLLFSALENEKFVLWIDADIVKVPYGLLQTMVESGKDIITPRCRIAPDEEDYDQNAWQGPRRKPTAEQQRAMARGAIFIPDQIHGVTKHLSDFLKLDPKREKEFVKLDSVGGTVLFVKSEVHKQGVIFPTDYIVGTEWDHLGYDGIETEGLCYLAKTIGVSCWGMPHVVVEHDAS